MNIEQRNKSVLFQDQEWTAFSLFYEVTK